MLRTALALALTLATSANATKYLGVPVELEREQLELKVPRPQNSHQGVSENFDGGVGPRATSTQDCDCEIFIVARGLAVVRLEDSFSLYAFAGLDPINRWDPFGLSNSNLARIPNDKASRAKVIFNITGRYDAATGAPLRPFVQDAKLRIQGDIASVGATTGSEAPMGAAGAAAAAGLARAANPGGWQRFKNWLGKLLKPGEGSIAPPIRAPSVTESPGATRSPAAEPQPTSAAPRAPVPVGLPKEFYDIDEAASAALQEPASVTGRIGNIGPVKNPDVRSALENAGYIADDFNAVQYEATGVSGKTYVITVFEAKGGVFFGPHISSSNL